MSSSSSSSDRRRMSPGAWALLWILILLQCSRINLESSRSPPEAEASDPVIRGGDPAVGSTRKNDMQTSTLPPQQSPPPPAGGGGGDDGGDESSSSRLPHLSLSEFKRRMESKMQRTLHCSNPSQEIRHRLETGGGGEYNFAAASHGAKLVASNKDSKGGGSILHNDKEKYYRSPCAADKFVVVQLSEEALVDSFLIANYELYASNLKEFELHGSLSYPAEEWRLLGSFEAENTRQAHRFRLAKPEWVRYLKLQMVSHYGTEFYCTLSSLEVYGIDAIECLLEDWVGGAQNHHHYHHQVQEDRLPSSSSTSSASTGETSSGESHLVKPVIHNPEAGDESGAQQQQLGSSSRLGDSVLKLVMQKVQALEINQSVFERYVEELNSNYKEHFAYLQENLVSSRRAVQNLTASIATLVTLIRKLEDDWEAERNHLQEQLKRHVEAEAAYVHVVSNQIEHMENRETLAIAAALLIMLASGVGRLFYSNIFDRSHFLLACFACVSVIILSS